MPTPRMAVPSLAEQPTWRTSARCRSDDAVHFFGPQGETREQRRRREDTARRLCGTCPVQSECLAYALAVQEPHGIWGGLDELERRRLLRAGSPEGGPAAARGVPAARQAAEDGADQPGRRR